MSLDAICVWLPAALEDFGALSLAFSFVFSAAVLIALSLAEVVFTD